ncbi:PREDICTED: gamma-glutamyltranspeptidase 1-like [Acropora digitifera]|uniref:gamma-glutamyltranspeptidase 1-like n=1 Tax=Acropora digitifera TaxID=70779 RepID=UPI00077A9A36|nr:PREDICTED: gamma-glutamyltranspeptidase 1-like [Acropora digitifera]
MMSGRLFRCSCATIFAALLILCALSKTGFSTNIKEKVHKKLTPADKTNSGRRSEPLGEPSEPLEFKTAAVAADYKTCSEYGAKVLKDQNGNAVDAALATALCVGVVNAHSAGIGGGGFMIIYNKTTGETKSINFRERAGEHQKADTMKDYQHLMYEWKIREQKTHVPGEGEFIGVPGELRGFEIAWKKYGSLPWKALFGPAIEIATNGFKATPALIGSIEKNAPNISNDPGLSELFKPNGRFLKLGDLVQRTKYAKTLEKIAESGGSDIFYTGEMGKQVVKDLNSIGSKLTLKDLKTYNASESDAVVADMPGVTGYKICTVPPPAGGVTLINILNILKGDYYYYYAVVKQMISPTEGENIRMLIDDTTHPYDYYGPINYHIDVTEGTTHLSVLDKDGNAVSLTTSINKYFGSKMRSTKLGVIYNDQMWDSVNLWVNEFNLKADTMRPRKRPMSLASPSIVLDGDGNVRMVIGAAGGKYIATALAQVLMNYYWFGDNLKDAVSKPRLHSQLFPNMVLVESTFPKKYIKGLRKYGHKYFTNDSTLITGTPKQIMGVVQLVVREDNGNLLALADYRKGGVAAGYR